jgi:hypothetical protein
MAELDDVVCALQRSSIDSADEFVESAKKFLAERKYFVSKRNSETIKQFFKRIYAVINGIVTGVKNNRISVILIGSKQCGRTTLMKHTVDFLSTWQGRVKVCAVYFECVGNQLKNKTPMELLLNRAQELSLLNQDDICAIQQSEFITTTLQAFQLKSIVPFIFYDEADLLWAKNRDNFVHCMDIIDQLHAIGNNGYAFGCLSGSTWKLVSLAWKKDFKTSTEYPRFNEYQSLNHQKYSELPLYPLTDTDDTCSFLALYGKNVSAEAAAHCVVVTGGRFEYVLNPEIRHFDIFKFKRGSLEWAIWDMYLAKNENLLLRIKNDSEIHMLLEIVDIGRDTLERILLEREFDCNVDDLVDKDILVPRPGNPHYFLPACIHCVYQLWQYERAHGMSIELVRALRYPMERPHAELLEWYCHVDSIACSMEFISLTPPGEANRAGRTVHDISNLSLDDIINLAISQSRFKPFNDSGVDMIQLRLVRGNGRWPKITIFVDCIQIKLSDQSTICGLKAKEIADKLSRVCDAYTQNLRKKMSMVKRVNFESGDLCLYCTWNISSPAASVFSERSVKVVEGRNITWHAQIISFCQREEIKWIKY